MRFVSFLQTLPLPAFDGLALAATALRSLELYSDLALGVTPPAPLAPRQRFDLTDECLDLVLLQPDLPAGFAFTGLSLAHFWAALLRAHPDEATLAPWRAALASDAFQALRDAARRRIADRTPAGYLRAYWLRLPPGHHQAPRVSLPAALSALLHRADPAWVVPERSRLAIDLLEEVVTDQPWPTGGTDFPPQPVTSLSRWLRWPEYRLHAPPAAVEFAELALALPSLEVSYFSGHFIARNVFAHVRTIRFTAADGRRVLLLHEVQSDWLRDLRFQRLGKRPTQERPYIPLVSVPACPLEQDWLRIALGAFIQLADRWDCDWLAWTPAAVQLELNPTLPSRIARRLYDRQVPRLLAELVAPHQAIMADLVIPGKATADPRPPAPVAYPTYRRDIQIGKAPGCGWYLMAMPGEARLTATVADFDATLAQLRDRATPIIEWLPALPLRPPPTEPYERERTG